MIYPPLINALKDPKYFSTPYVLLLIASDEKQGQSQTTEARYGETRRKESSKLRNNSHQAEQAFPQCCKPKLFRAILVWPGVCVSPGRIKFALRKFSHANGGSKGQRTPLAMLVSRYDVKSRSRRRVGYRIMQTSKPVMPWP